MAAMHPPVSLSVAQYNWNTQPDSFASPQYDYISYSPECAQGSLHPTPLSACDTIPETDGGSLDYELLFNLDFLLSSEMALLSPIDGYYDFATPPMQVAFFDLRNLPMTFL